SSIPFKRGIGAVFSPARSENISTEYWCTVRIFGDDVDNTTHRLRSVQRCCRTFHYLYSLYQAVGNAIQSIYCGKGADDRHSVYQYHGIWPLHSINMNIARVTDITIQLRLHAVDESYRVKQTGRWIFPEKLRCKHFHRN